MTITDERHAKSEPSAPAEYPSTLRWLAGWAARRLTAAGVLAVTALACLIPVAVIFWQSLSLGPGGLADVFASETFRVVLVNTMVMLVGSVLVAVVLGTTLAWFAHCLPPKLRWLGLIPMLPMVAPPLAVVVGYVFLLQSSAGYANVLLRRIFPSLGTSGPFNVNTMPWIILISGLIFASFMFLFVRSSLSQLRQDLLDAASVSGAGPFRVFIRVVLPLIRPGLVFGTLTVTLLSMGQFTVPLLLGRGQLLDVLTTIMFNSMNEYPANYALAATYGLPILVAGLLFIALQRVLLRDSSRFETSGGKGAGTPLTHNGWFAQGVLVLYGVLAVLLPLLALFLVSVQPFWSSSIDFSALTFDNYRKVFAEEGLVSAIWNSVRFSLSTVVISLPLGYLCARTIYWRREAPFMSWLQEIVVSIPLGIPSVILGAGFLVSFIFSPIPVYGTTASMVIAYTVVMLPFVVRVFLTAMTNHGATYIDAASVHGAGWLRTAWKVELPLLRPAMGSAAAFCVVLLSHEFSVSVLIRTQDTQVMGTVLYDLFVFGSYGQTAVMGVIMSLVTLAGLVSAFAIGGSSALTGSESIHG